jgi:hypothetical protein
MAPEAGLADTPQQLLQGAVAKEVDSLVRQVEVDLLRRRVGLPSRPEHLLVSLRHGGRMLGVEVALLDQPLDDLVEELGQFLLDLLISILVSCRLTAEHPQHLRRELV